MRLPILFTILKASSLQNTHGLNSTTHGLNSFKYQSVKYWNSFPDNIRTLSNLADFKVPMT